MFQMIHIVGQFHGHATEVPHQHLKFFMGVWNSFKDEGLSKGVLRLKLFSYSLRGEARTWLESLSSEYITSWDDLTEKFLMKYFLPSKRLFQRCPYHGIPGSIQIETYYKGLDNATRLVIDASPNGALLVKPYAKALNILERISSSNHSWSDHRAIEGKSSKELVESESYTTLNSKIEILTDLNNRNTSYSNTYNPRLRNHPNFGWSGNQGGHNTGISNAPTFQQKVSYPPGFAYQGQMVEHNQSKGSITSLENIMKQYMANNDATVQSQAASLRNLELQVGQLAMDLKSRPVGALPSDTEVPKRDSKEQCNALTLRSGKALPPTHPNAPTLTKEPAQIVQGEPQSEQDSEPAEVVVPIPPEQIAEQPKEGQNTSKQSVNPVIARAPETGSSQNIIPEKESRQSIKVLWQSTG
ncbi:uncharacterized protein LOC111025053 [Momordica charantia]|uniref:Uncharacterized protein LOC111025053 n=1 Tax=Momordica charantia TaxID=3673 RepID=A0A6J1DWK1_MOMCH|nr:uncharacterized protein LOC111025053 [Momordica charantia]